MPLVIMLAAALVIMLFMASMLAASQADAEAALSYARQLRRFRQGCRAARRYGGWPPLPPPDLRGPAYAWLNKRRRPMRDPALKVFGA